MAGIRHRQVTNRPGKLQVDGQVVRPGMSAGVGERVVGYGEEPAPGLHR